ELQGIQRTERHQRQPTRCVELRSTADGRTSTMHQNLTHKTSSQPSTQLNRKPFEADLFYYTSNPVTNSGYMEDKAKICEANTIFGRSPPLAVSDYQIFINQQTQPRLNYLQKETLPHQTTYTNLYRQRRPQKSMSRSPDSNYLRSDQSREHKSVHWSNDVETESPAVSNGNLPQENVYKAQFKWSRPMVDTPIWTTRLNTPQPNHTEKPRDLRINDTVSSNRSQSVGPSVRPKAKTGNLYGAIPFPATLADIITAKTNSTSPISAVETNNCSSHSNILPSAGTTSMDSQHDHSQLSTTPDHRRSNAGKEHRFHTDVCHGSFPSSIYRSNSVKHRDQYKSSEMTEEEHTDEQKCKSISTAKVSRCKMHKMGFPHY
ncbi:hypothetical protein EG68_04708, partial [Paragonimus skrjabini miyazakii]